MIVNGTSGNDELIENYIDSDALYGLDGNDTIFGGTGNDSLYGGNGNDYLIAGPGYTVLDGGSGFDLVDYGGATSGITVDLAASGWQTINNDHGSDILTNIEAVYASDYNDVVRGTHGDNDLLGFFGNDALHGRRGSDYLNGGAGNDTLYGDGLNIIDHYTTQTVDNNGDGYAETYYYANGDYMVGGAGDDTYYLLNGGTSTSYFSYPSGKQRLDAVLTQEFRDSAVENAAEGIDKVFVGFDNYTLDANIENLELLEVSAVAPSILLQQYLIAEASGNELNNILVGNSSTNILYGMAGNDSLNGAGGNDSLLGGDGNDTLVGGDGADSLTGGAGNDSLAGGAGADLYIIENAGDTVSESSASGIDEIRSAVSWTLGNYQENLVLTGSSSTNGTGNTLNNVISGNAGNNALEGGAGNDTLTAGAGTDVVTYANATGAVAVSLLLQNSVQNTGATTGSDSLSGFENLRGSAHNDSLSGDNNQNALYGGSGNDSISALNGNDSLFGEAGNDTLLGGDGVDNIEGGLGDDSLVGGAGVDTLSYSSSTVAVKVSLGVTTAQVTGAGSDTVREFENISGSAYNDTLTGDTAANHLSGSNGADSLAGGDQNDTLTGGAGDDTLSGGAGSDTARYADMGAAVKVSLAAQGAAQNTLGAGNDWLTGVENLLGTAFNDSLTGDGVANVLDGEAGNDSINGGGEADTINGGLGNDSLDGGTGINTVSYAGISGNVTVSLLSLGVAQNTGAAGTDVLSAFDNIIGGSANDLLTGNGNNNILQGGAGNDSLNGGVGIDTASYSLATAAVTVNLAIQDGVLTQNTGGAGIDRLAGFENASGSAFNDVLLGDAVANTLWGAAGNDSLNGNAGNDTLFGDAGDDTLMGGVGADSLIGGAGNDTYHVDDLADLVVEDSSANGVADQVFSSVSFSLGSRWIETLTLTGTADNYASGNSQNNVIYGNAGANQMRGWAGNDTLAGGAGNDNYQFRRGWGVETVVENDATVGNADRLEFDVDIAADQLWFSHVGNNLEVSIIGSADKLVLSNWYLGSNYHVESMIAGDGQTLNHADVEALVSAMAGMTPPPMGQTTLTPEQHAALDATIAASWN